jgi:single-strand DNA-binding protein
MRYTPAGQPVTSFSAASTRTYMKGDEKVEETTWVRVTTWGKLAENCSKFLAKGAKVYVEGRLTPDANGSPRIWTNKDGAPAASYEITAYTVLFLSKRGDGSEEAISMGGAEGSGEDIPF